MYFLHNELFSFYKDIMIILDLKSLGANDSLYLHNKNLKNDNHITCDGKQIVLNTDIQFGSPNHEELVTITFNPLNEKYESCSRLVIEDSIHFYLRKLIHNLFSKVITIKDGTYLFEQHSFDKTLLDKLQNPTKYTKFKFYNLFNIVTATSFSKNLISFTIHPTDPLNQIKVDFYYPLYEVLCTLQNNIFYGIDLEYSEIKLFKQIYENYIIEPIDKLFKDSIKIPDNSSNFPHLYILLTIRLSLEKIFYETYDIRILSFNNKIHLPKYFKMISKLNDLTDMKSFITKHQQELDQNSYKNELEIRKVCEVNWLILKENKMQDVLHKQEKMMLTDRNKEIKTFVEHITELAEKKYMRQIHTFLTNERVNDFIENYQQRKNDQKWVEVFYWQNLVLNILNGNGASLWFDTRLDKYCFRSKVGGNIVYENKEGISELLTRALYEKINNNLNANNFGFFTNHAIEIVLVHKLHGIHNQQLKASEKASNVIKILLFENAIPTIDDDKFDTESSREFIKHNNDFFYTRNRFIPTKYLLKRFENRYLTDNHNVIDYDTLFKLNENGYLLEALEETTSCKRSSFIEDFIYYLVNEDIHSYYYVMNWLSSFFNSLQKSGTALVLLGDQEVTQILWDKIIKEIFGLLYCVTINDKECSSASAFDIAKDKLFFHIGNITDAGTKFDDETLYKLVKDLLIKPSIPRLNENNIQEEITIHGQLIVTANNPSPYIKRASSKCTIIKVSDLDTIIEKLNVPDELILEHKIQEDLDNFADVLNFFSVKHEFAKYAMDTDARKSVCNNKSSNIVKEDIDKEIDIFIQAIKNKDLDYFERVKEVDDDTIYAHLKNAFEKDDGYFIGMHLLDYYNATHEQKFKRKDDLTQKLKAKDDMFKQEVKTLKILTAEKEEQILFQAYPTSKETGNKELYKINGYTLAKDIIVPYGATITSSQDNLTKFDYDNYELTLKLTKKYREEKAQEKANS